MTDLMIGILNSGATTGEMGTTPQWLSSVYPIVMVVVMLAVFYFLILRPQRKRDKEQREMMNTLSVGDKVTTIGGLVGYVAQIKDDDVTISTSVANTLVTFTKASIQTVEKRESSSKSSSDSKSEDSSEGKGLFGFGKKKKDADEE
ncbi:Preprotein translocase subunit [Ruminococcaceae bacterium YRB3002]|nr:Preprotein translocase subunit [Ruminococcaceae bacterium YRB3002]